MNECACGQSTTPEQSVNKGLPTRQPYLAPHDGANDEKDPMMNKSPETHPAWRSPYPTVDEFQRKTRPEDRINDTVGAIAIDQSGNIAAGSSSGGIGMKHRGRVGPAALVGVGTAVVPVDADDPYGITVAAVTSGTGEHMATTMASQRCAERIYQGNIRGHGGKDVPEDDENVILESFITRDFLGHPSVKSSSSTGAIGVMTVKKTPGGYYLYFAHNTESFALASMGSNDIGPATVMSRLNDGGSPIATGARKISI
jgi:taspase (threonine aspartase 1)